MEEQISCMTIEKQNILEGIRNKIKGQTYKCVCPGCSNNAIKSHYLQRHGILDTISTNNKFWELKHKPVFFWNKGDYAYEFKEIGINDAFQVKTFCKEHDNTLFSSLENNNLDCNDYESQLRLSFRTICNDLRKHEQALLQWELIQDEESILEITPEKNVKIEAMKGRISLLLEIQNDLKTQLWDELEQPSGKFSFVHLSYPNIKVYASNSFGIYTEKGIIPIFIHVIPTKDSTEIIIGFQTKYTSQSVNEYVDRWKGLTYPQLQRMLSELFVKHIENFGLSPELYHCIPETKLKKFYEYLGMRAKDVDMEEVYNPYFNLFDY